MIKMSTNQMLAKTKIAAHVNKTGIQIDFVFVCVEVL